MEYVRYCQKRKLRINSDKNIKFRLGDFGIYESRILENGIQNWYWCGLTFKKTERLSDLIIKHMGNVNCENIDTEDLIQEFINQDFEEAEIDNVLKVMVNEGILYEPKEGSIEIVK